MLIERLERGTRGPELTYCQQARVVDAVATAICSELGLASSRGRPHEIAGVWANVDPATVCEEEDLVARVAARIAAYVIPAS